MQTRIRLGFAKARGIIEILFFVILLLPSVIVFLGFIYYPNEGTNLSAWAFYGVFLWILSTAVLILGILSIKKPLEYRYLHLYAGPVSVLTGLFPFIWFRELYSRIGVDPSTSIGPFYLLATAGLVTISGLLVTALAGVAAWRLRG